MTNKILKHYKGFLVGLLMAVLLVGGYAIADVIVNIYENGNGEQVAVEDEMLGGGGPSLRVPWDFKEGIQVDGTEVINTSGQYTGGINTSLDASISNPDATYQFDLDFTQATTTTGTADPTTQLLLGTQLISGNMLCNMAAADLTATGIFGYDFRLGTSTSATSSDAHLIADTAVTTSTDDILNKEDDEGTSSDEVWSVSDGEYFSAMMTFDATNATSGASFTTAGGNAGAGTVHVNCWNSD